MIEWVAKECNAIVTGFFVMTKKRDYYNLKREIYGLDFVTLSDDMINKEWSQLRKNGLVINNIKGYNKLMLTLNTKTEEDSGLSDELVGQTKGKILNAFRNNQKGKLTSRFIANEFMKEIA